MLKKDLKSTNTFVVFVLFSCLFSCTQKTPLKTFSELETFEKSQAKDSITIGYWGNIHGLLKECGCDFTPFGGFKRRERALNEIKQNPFFSDALFLDFGNLLSPSEEKYSKAHIEKLLKLSTEQANAGFHINTDDQKLLNEKKITIPPLALTQKTNQEARLINNTKGLDFLLLASDDTHKITAAEVTTALDKVKDKNKTLPVILNSGHLSVLDYLSSDMNTPYLVIGGSDKIQGPYCYEKKKGLYCFGVWEGKQINFIRLFKTLSPNISTIEGWVSLSELFKKADKLEGLESAKAKEKLIDEAYENYAKYSENLDKKWVYDTSLITLDEKTYGKND